MAQTVIKSAVKRFGSLHRAAGMARWYFDRHIRTAYLALKTERAYRSQKAIAFDIGGNIGMGAILAHAAYALRTGYDRNTSIGLRFTSPLYRPPDGPNDWLDCYFTRRGYAPDGLPALKSDALRFDYKSERDHPLLWNYLQIKSEFFDEAKRMAGPEPFAAVHYRGSDKFMETRRVAESNILRRVEDEMTRINLNKLFVASDEANFIELARDRFGSSAFWLPCEAMASGLNAAHFSRVSGETKAREALVTMAALSNAAVCVRTPSFLSEWARTLAHDGTTILIT